MLSPRSVILLETENALSMLSVNYSKKSIKFDLLGL